MRLADYVDEQRFHLGKMRFHNEKLHGAGILCGLKVSLLAPDGVALRVARGAALDDCGREIVVGYDQCVDVAEWFKAQKRTIRADDDRCKPDRERRVRLCVVLAYSECAGAPESAPQSICAPQSGCSCGGCGSGGCSCGGGGARACPDPCGEHAEFGRVTEEFQLKLMFWEDAKRVTEHALYPSKDEIDAAVAEASGGIGLLQSLAKPIRERCPGSDDGWLLLACFDAVLDQHDDDEVVAVRNIDHECASQVLLSTEVIQYLLAELFAEVDPDIGGPEIANIAFRKTGPERYQFSLTLTAEIDDASLDVDGSFDLRRLKDDGWDAPSSNTVSAKYATSMRGDYDVDGPAIYLIVENSGRFLEPGGRYQLFIPPASEPVVDAQLRHLRPRNLAWRFGIERDPDSGDLVTVPLAQGAPYGR
jgi:hypothetical protein